jgi:hypothetical protein
MLRRANRETVDDASFDIENGGISRHISVFTKVISRRLLMLQFSNTYLFQKNKGEKTHSVIPRHNSEDRLLSNIRRENLKIYVII